MTDPFEALSEPVTPVDPDPGFARRLRLRLSREVLAPTARTAPTGGTMSQQTTAAGTEREPAWPPALTPYIVVSDARRAMDWYAEVLGAQRRGEPIVNPDGTIGHADRPRAGVISVVTFARTDRPREKFGAGPSECRPSGRR